MEGILTYFHTTDLRKFGNFGEVYGEIGLSALCATPQTQFVVPVCFLHCGGWPNALRLLYAPRLKPNTSRPWTLPSFHSNLLLFFNMTFSCSIFLFWMQISFLNMTSEFIYKILIFSLIKPTFILFALWLILSTLFWEVFFICAFD